MKMNMKNTAILIGIAVLVITFTLTAEGADRKSKKLLKDAVATVNGEPISTTDFERQVNIARQRYASQGQNIDESQMGEFRKKILDNLIDSELIYQESKKSGYIADEEQITSQFEGIKKQFPDDKEFEAALSRMDYTSDSLKEDIRRSITVQNFIEKEIASSITIPEKESREYYSSHPEAFSQPEQIRARHILILVGEGADEKADQEALNKIKEVQKKLQNGADFEALAKEYSEGPSAKQGGDLGFFQRGQMVKPFEVAAFALQPGEVSPIVKTQYGYHLIKVTDKRAGVNVPYEHMKNQIDEYLKQAKIQEKIGNLLEKMRLEATVVRLLPDQTGKNTSK